jgi:hypothetical protein
MCQPYCQLTAAFQALNLKKMPYILSTGERESSDCSDTGGKIKNYVLLVIK